MSERFNGPYKVKYLEPGEKINRFLILDRDRDFITPEQGIVYIDQKKQAWFRCPCNGLGDDDCKKNAVRLNLDPEMVKTDPSLCTWEFRQVGDFADFSPSIWRDARRGCHFFIREGMVQWC